MKYRLYVDEVGNSDLSASEDPNHRYLSLTGVILELGQVAAVTSPALEELKARFFGSHPDDPVILRRKELVNRKHPFECLRDVEIGKAFDEALLGLLHELDFTVMTPVIDKLEQTQRYHVAL